MEKYANKLIIQFILSSSDGWTDISCEQKFGRLAEDLGDITPQSMGQYSTTGGICL
jgi:hypothetical protein